MNTIVIIQARMGSTRLPGKVLLPLGDSTVLDYVVSRCRKIQGVSHVIVATSDLTEDDQIAHWCQEHEVDVFRGSQLDVLERYYRCAQVYQPEYVIRVTSDCPFVDYKLAEQTIQAMKTQPSDIVINDGQEQLTRGLSVEMISYTALEKIYQQSSELRHREHVTYYAYEYSEQFTSTTIIPPAILLHPQLRMTVDTMEDYELCRILANRIEDSKNAPSEAYIDYLLQHPEVASINAHIQQKPVQ